MPGFRDYLNANNPNAAAAGAAAAQGGTGEYGAMIAQMMSQMGNQRAAATANRMSQAPGGQMPGGPGMPGDTAAPAPQPTRNMGGYSQLAGMAPQGRPQMPPQQIFGPGMGQAPQGGGMDDYQMGRLIGQMLRQQGGGR